MMVAVISNGTPLLSSRRICLSSATDETTFVFPVSAKTDNKADARRAHVCTRCFIVVKIIPYPRERPYPPKVGLLACNAFDILVLNTYL